MKTFFVPAHITGFFEKRLHDSVVKTGSLGAGIVLDVGMETGAIVKISDETTVKVFHEGSECRCQTTHDVVSLILMNTCGAYDIEIHHFSKLPLETGFGLSASGALGAAFALNNALDIELDPVKIGEAAHCSEVENKTGLGDVIAELSKGLVLRTREGAPGTGKTKCFPLDTWVVCFIADGPLSTRSVLENGSMMCLVNQIGADCIKDAVKELNGPRFMELSQSFALRTGLANRYVRKVIEDLGERGHTASMCMLGNAVFTLTDDPDSVKDLIDLPSIVARPLDKEITS